MSRTARKAPGGLVYHVINRGVGRQTLFHKEEDYAAFERVLAEAWQRVPTRILGYCLMPHARAWPTFAAIHGGNGQEPSGMNRVLFSSSRVAERRQVSGPMDRGLTSPVIN